MANVVLWKSSRDHSFRPSPTKSSCPSVTLFQVLSSAAVLSHLHRMMTIFPTTQALIILLSLRLPVQCLLLQERSHTPLILTPAISKCLQVFSVRSLQVFLRCSPGSSSLFQPNHKWLKLGTFSAFPTSSPWVSTLEGPQTSRVSARLCSLLTECIDLLPWAGTLLKLSLS